MPDKRKHRGPHPHDTELFASENIPRLRAAAADFQWLLDRGYAERSSLKLVGDRYELRERQRRAVLRSTCNSAAAKSRREHEIAISAIKKNGVVIDGFNLLILLESALSGGFLFRGADGCLRDLASVHGSYRKVHETEAAFCLVGEALSGVKVHWLFDRPVSNSGRTKAICEQVATDGGGEKAVAFDWSVELLNNPDEALIREKIRVVVSSDSVVLDAAAVWCNLGEAIVGKMVPDAKIVNLF